MKLLRSLAAVALLAAAWMSSAAASVIFTETTDAGDSLTTAADTTAVVGLSRINGRLSNEPSTLDYVDMFKLSITSAGRFKATTGTLFDPFLIADPVLFLFDASGIGIAMDDESGGDSQASLGFTLAPGDYFLAIAFAGIEPLDINGNPIFNAFGDLAVISTGALGSWSGPLFAIDPAIVGAYSFSVPLPGTLALVLLGLAAAANVRSRQSARS